MLTKLIGYINFYIIKLKYYLNKNIKFPLMNRFPISLSLEIDKTSNFEMGKKVGINKNVTIRVRKNAKCKIGDGVNFNNGCILTCRERIEIGNNVLFGPNVMIFDHDHNYKAKDMKNEFIKDKIIIEDNCWIGANSIILKGTRIGKNSVIAAGSIVKNSVPDNTVFYNEKIEKMKNINIKENNILN